MTSEGGNHQGAENDVGCAGADGEEREDFEKGGKGRHCASMGEQLQYFWVIVSVVDLGWVSC